MALPVEIISNILLHLAAFNPDNVTVDDVTNILNAYDVAVSLNDTFTIKRIKPILTLPQFVDGDLFAIEQALVYYERYDLMESHIQFNFTTILDAALGVANNNVVKWLFSKASNKCHGGFCDRLAYATSVPLDFCCGQRTQVVQTLLKHQHLFDFDHGDLYTWDETLSQMPIKYLDMVFDGVRGHARRAKMIHPSVMEGVIQRLINEDIQVCEWWLAKCGTRYFHNMWKVSLVNQVFWDWCLKKDIKLLYK